jgi:polysaccharide biosynthesis protein PslH
MNSTDSSLKILFIAPYIPSPIRVRPYQLIRQLSRLGHRVTLVALADKTPGDSLRQELAEYCEKVHLVPHPIWRGALQSLTALPTPTPLWSAYCRSSALARILQTILSENTFDVAHIEHLRAAHFGRDLKGLPTVFDAVDCITALQKQMMEQAGSIKGRAFAWEEWTKLKRFEPTSYQGFHQIAVTSQFDARELALLSEKLPPVTVIPNGVDLEYFKPTFRPAHPDRLVFTGKMSYRANDDAARYLVSEILPRVRVHRPKATLTIAGSQPSRFVQEMAEKGNIEVTGYVDDLRPYLADASVAVCPMRIGVGIQNKALEAMAMGRPVVCSPIAGRALEGAAVIGALRIASSPETFARECADLLKCQETNGKAGSAARRYVESYHRWECAAESFIELYHRARTTRKGIA